MRWTTRSQLVTSRNSYTHTHTHTTCNHQPQQPPTATPTRHPHELNAFTFCLLAHSFSFSFLPICIPRGRPNSAPSTYSISSFYRHHHRPHKMLPAGATMYCPLLSASLPIFPAFKPSNSHHSLTALSINATGSQRGLSAQLRLIGVAMYLHWFPVASQTIYCIHLNHT